MKRESSKNILSCLQRIETKYLVYALCPPKVLLVQRKYHLFVLKILVRVVAVIFVVIKASLFISLILFTPQGIDKACSVYAHSGG